MTPAPTSRTEEAPHKLTYRHDLGPADAESVRRLTVATGVFTPEESEVAVELVETRLTQGPASGYEFVLAERRDEIVGYACFGPIPATLGRYDLYWIVVRHDLHGAGLGTAILAEAEARIAAAGGVHVYVETSTRDDYAPTRAFYLRRGYEQAALLPDFYRDGDGKLILVKRL